MQFMGLGGGDLLSRAGLAREPAFLIGGLMKGGHVDLLIDVCFFFFFVFFFFFF